MKPKQRSGRSRAELKRDFVRCPFCGSAYDQKEGHRCKSGGA